MRHVLRFPLFPGLFEPVASQRHQELIARAFDPDFVAPDRSRCRPPGPHDNDTTILDAERQSPRRSPGVFAFHPHRGHNTWMIDRTMAQMLPRGAPPRRIVVLTGARQVGKTTLARALYEPGLTYLNLDSPGERSRLAAVPAEAWAQVVGEAVLDEVQKLPGVLEKVKWAYDAEQIEFTVLAGSSRILLLEQVRETLAGRVFLYELWPMTVHELVERFGGARTAAPLIARLLAAPQAAAELLEPGAATVVGPNAGAAQAAMQHVLQWGGLPPLLQYPESERLAWLDAYHATYLERDLADLARLRDLESFTRCHRLAAARAGRILSYSELARDAGLPVTTTRRYLRYLELSYQTLTLPAWSGNVSVRLIKSPKLIWFDAGVQRALSGAIDGLTGAQYESFVLGQMLTTLWSHRLRFDASYLRTSGGLEVDLILECFGHLLAFEIKNRPMVDRRDAASIERARRLLGDRFRAGVVVYRGDRVFHLTDAVFAVPDWVLLGG